MVIFDRIPRHDPHNVDPYGLKSELSNYGNKIYRQLKEKSKMKEKIVIGEHSLDFKGNMKEKIYGRENFDGIHMRGPLGFNFYTRSVLNMLTKASLTCATKSQRLNRETTQNSNHPSGKNFHGFQHSGRNFHSSNEKTTKTGVNNQPSGSKSKIKNIQAAERNYHSQKQYEYIQPAGRKEFDYRTNHQVYDADLHPAGTNHFTRGKVSKDQYTSYNVNVANRFTPLGNW